MAVLDPFEQDSTAVVPGGSEVPVPAPRGSALSGRSVLDPFETTPAETLQNALPKSPDKEAEAQRNSRFTPAPVSDPEAAKNQARLAQIEQTIEGDEAVKNFLSVPENADIAHDDVENLSALSQVLKSIQDTIDPRPALEAFASQVVETPFRMAQGLIQLDRAVVPRLSTDVRTSLEKLGLTGLAAALAAREEGQELLFGATESGREFAQDLGPDERTFATDVAGGLGQLTSQITLLLLSGGLTATVGLVGEGASIQADMIEAAGESVEDNPEAVVMGAAVTAITERLGLDLLLNRIPAQARGRLFNILASAGAEGAQEVLEGVLQNLVALELYDPSQQIFSEETLREGRVASVVGAIAGLIIPGRQALRGAQVLEEAAQVAQESKLAQRAPERLGELASTVLEEAGVSEVYIPGTQLAQWIMNQPDPQAVMFGLGVQNKLEEAVASGGDVTIDGQAFSQHILLSQDYVGISPHIRLNQDGMTVAETEEMAGEGFEAEILAALDSFSDPAITQDPELEMAEGLMGLRGLFGTAEEAGMTPGQYEDYLAQVQRAAEKGAKNKELSDLNRQQRLNTREFKETEENTRQQVTETLNVIPAYAALNGIRAERLDRARTQEILGEMGVTVEQLPKQKGNRAVYANLKGEPGLDPDVYAEMQGYEDAEQMFSDMLTSTPYEQAIEVETQRIMRAKHPEIFSEQVRIAEAKAALMTDEHSEMIAMELNALRFFQGQGKLKNSVVRNAAKDQIAKRSIKDINVNKLLAQSARLAKAAARALKKGDRATAVDLKFKQLVSYHMAKEATKAQKTMDRQAAYLRKFARAKNWPSMPPKYLEAIQETLKHFRFADPLTPRRLQKALDVANQKADPAGYLRDILKESAKTHWRDMTVAEFRDLHNAVKEVHHKGTQDNKLRKERESRELDIVVAVLSDEVRRNLKATTPGSLDPTKWEQAKRYGQDLGSLLFHIDTILREIDGFQDLGPAHQNILGRYNDAMSNGYLEGQQGFVNREQAEAKAIVKLYSVFSKRERLAFHKKVKVPGVSQKISHQTILSVLLNSGNQGNIDAMVDSGTFTEAEIEAIHNYASKKDWDFAQSVWDYLEGFWPEVVETEQRRRNVTPERVGNKAVDTPHGTYRGGYYPIRYDRKQSVFYSSEDAQEMIDAVKYGDHVASQTAHGHTMQRQDSQGHKMLLDLFVLNSHVQRMIYDLEVGDAVRDIYKIVHNPAFKTALTEQGQRHKWDAIDMWLRDIITGEVGVDNALEKGMRWLRTRLTVVGLGWNIGVIGIQIFGLSQTMVTLGRANTLSAMRLLGQPQKWAGKNSVFNYIDSQSPFMAARSSTWHKDIADAQTATRTSMLDRVTPGKSAVIIRETLFVGIKKMQRMVDAITWIAAKKKGMEQFKGDEKLAIKYADDVVMRSQASGIFGHRTAVERGTYGPGKQQSEFVRAFTLFYSYFARKLNITIEQTKKTSFRSPWQVIKWANDMAFLFMWESLLVALLRGEGPDDGEEDGWLGFAAGETALTVMGAVPGVREIASAIQGFPSGGTIGRVSADLAKAAEQLGEGEVDESFIKSMLTLVGIVAKAPTGQLNKLVGAFSKQEEGEDVKAIEWIMGPQFDK